MRVATNLVANLLGQGWTAVLNLAAVPFYLHVLGVDAFGLIGLYTVVLTIVTLLDAGMATTLNREMVKYVAGERSRADTRDLLRSVEIVLGVAGGMLAVAAFGIGPVLARLWIAPSTIPLQTVSFSITMMVLASVLRIFEAIYRAALLGLHRPILMNGLSFVTATLRIVGVFGVFAVTSTSLHTFFAWQAIVGVLALVMFATATTIVIGRSDRPARFRWALLAEIRGFAGGAFTIAALGVALTQLDKVIVARLVPLRELGYYSAAVVIATGIYQIVLPFFHSFYPRLSFLHATGDRKQFAATYLRGASLLAVVAGPPIAVLTVFGHTVLLVWTDNAAVASAAAPLLRLLGPGALAYGLYHLPLAALLASGAQRVAVRAAAIALLLLVPGILIGFELAGMVGVAGAWSAVMGIVLILNLAGTRQAVLATVSIARLLRASLGPVAVAFAVSGLALLLPLADLGSRLAIAAGIVGTGIVVLVLTALLTWNGAIHSRLRLRGSRE